MWDAFMDPTLKAPLVQGPRERCPGPTRQEPFVAYCSFSLRSPPPGSPTWSYRKLWSYRCPRPFTLCLPPFVHGPRGRCPGPTRQKPFGAYCPFPFALHHRGVVATHAARTAGHQPCLHHCASRSPSQEALFPPAHPLSRVRGTHQVWSYRNVWSYMVASVLQQSFPSTRGHARGLWPRRHGEAFLAGRDASSP